MEQALLSLIAVLIAALVWVVKSETRKNSVLITALTTAVDSFKAFEQQEDEIHDSILQNQAAILAAIERIADKLGVPEQ